MKVLSIAAVILISSLAALTASPAEAATGFLKHSWIDGSNRICVYTSLGREYYITIRATKACKLSVKFNER